MLLTNTLFFTLLAGLLWVAYRLSEVDPIEESIYCHQEEINE
jgi:hypothetical protein